MISRTLKILIFFASLTACNLNQRAEPTNTPKPAPLSETTQTALNAQSNTVDAKNISKVDPLSLDDAEFGIQKLALGLQDYLQASTPVLSYSIPENGDYVEILRCPADLDIVTAGDSINIADLEMSTYSEQKKSQLYRSSDFFGGAETAGCVLITDGNAANNFYDSFSPSGNYRYLVRACVTPERLSTTGSVSKRNCSHRVAVSSAIDFKNTRKDKENKCLRLAAAYSARIDQISKTLQLLAIDANNEINSWEDREQDRAINLKLRKAWVNVAAAILEVSIELKTIPVGGMGAKEIFKYYSSVFNPKKNTMSTLYGRWQPFVDATQFLGAMQGYLTGQTINDILSSSQDLPRSPARYKRILDETNIIGTRLSDAYMNYQLYGKLASLAKSGAVAIDGAEVSVPDISSLREFDQPAEEESP